jgi:hypothetical protein
MRDRPGDAAFVITMMAFLLLSPPVLTIFNRDATVLGLPLLHAYCFTAWLAAIAAGAWLATRFARTAPPLAPGPPSQPPGD